MYKYCYFQVLDCIDTIQMSSSVEVGGNSMNGIDNRIKRKSKGMNLKPDIGYGGNAGRSWRFSWCKIEFTVLSNKYLFYHMSLFIFGIKLMMNFQYNYTKIIFNLFILVFNHSHPSLVYLKNSSMGFWLTM